MDDGASEVTGISKEGNQLYHNGTPVEALGIADALDAFLDFLQRQGSSINLYGHNIKSFDCHVLFNALEAVGKKDKFESIVSSFLDTKIMLKAQFPDLESHTQQYLVNEFLNEHYSAHNAIEDVAILQKLVCLIQRED